MSVNVNLSAKKDMNLASLKRRYSTIESIIVDASLVVLYRYKKKADGSKYWTKEKVTGPLFVVEHKITSSTLNNSNNHNNRSSYSDPHSDPQRNSVVVINQEGRTDFNLAIHSISTIIPQEEFLMLRYLNQDMIVSTLAIWVQDYKQRDGVINAIYSSMNLRVGDIIPCNPYFDPNTQVKPIDSNVARSRLLDIIRQPKDNIHDYHNDGDDGLDSFTDIQISGKNKSKLSSHSSTSKNQTNGFSNSSGLQLLAKIQASSPSKENESIISSDISIATPVIKDSISFNHVSPVNVHSTLRDLYSPGTQTQTPATTSTSIVSVSESLPPAAMPVNLNPIMSPQQLFQPYPPYPPYPQQMQPMLNYPLMNTNPYMNSNPYMNLPVWPMQPLLGSPYDPMPPSQHLPRSEYNGHVIPNIHGPTHGYPANSEGAASYLMSRIGKPQHEPGR